MSSTIRRLVAVVAAAVLALLAGVVVGLASAQHAGLVAGRPVTGFELVPAILGTAGGLACAAAVFVLLIAPQRSRRELAALARADAARGEPYPDHSPGTRPAPNHGSGWRGRAPDLAPPAPEPAVPADAAARLAEADRAALIRACIYVRDRTTSPALADRLGVALHDAGVRPVDPSGTPFDPTRHEAGGSAPSPDPAVVGTVAAVEVAGYTDRDGQLLRVPVVTVYRAPDRDDR